MVSRLQDRDELVDQARQLQAALEDTKMAYQQEVCFKPKQSLINTTEINCSSYHVFGPSSLALGYD